MRLLRPFAVIAVCVVVVLAAHQLLKRSEPQARSRGGGETTVVAHPVETRSFADRTEAIGTALATESVIITPPVTERVARLHFENGASVAFGDTLVELEHAEEAAELEAEVIGLAEQERQFERVKSLRENDLVSQEELDLARDELQVSEARVEAAEARLRDRIITAPFAGVLGIRRVSPGTLVSPGQTITTLDDLSAVKVNFTVPEALLSQIAVGQPIRALSAAWPNEVFAGSATSIDSRVDPTTRAVEVESRIPNTQGMLRSGMLLTVELTCCPRDALGVPERALLSYADKQYVFVVGSDGTAEQREIELGVRDVGWVEVVGGLEPGEMVVVDGLLGLRDGAPVRVENGEAPTPDEPQSSSSISELP
ncbi:MAG TPA: efflux RND transporter periplasmic adaptor subunit [bacterium]|nr:efflux RND transporter periplasmic adaptor subunit [bacterium]